MAILLAPAASMYNNPNKIYHFMAIQPIRKILTFIGVKILKLYSLFPHDYVFNDFTFSLYKYAPLFMEYLYL